MYTHVVKALLNKIEEEIEDLLENSSTEKQFGLMKEAILQRLERSDNAMLRELLNNISMRYLLNFYSS